LRGVGEVRLKAIETLTRVRQKGRDSAMEVDREIEGAGRIYERAKKWGHLPRGMTFERFLAALRRGDDPYLKAASENSPN
jgi:hypothetical protein